MASVPAQAKKKASEGMPLLLLRTLGLDVGAGVAGVGLLLMFNILSFCFYWLYCRTRL
jgi:hypothetical protein